MRKLEKSFLKKGQVKYDEYWREQVNKGPN